MINVNVLYPDMLYLIIAVPLIIIMHFFALLKYKKRVFTFANYETLKRLDEDKKIFSKNIPQLLMRTLFVLILVLGISHFGIWLKVEGFADDIVVAVDASGSMFADDIEPTRLDAAKTALIQFVNNNSYGMEIGVLSFTSIGYLEENPTKDKVKLVDSISKINIKKSSGTSLGSAMNLAQAMFNEEESSKTLIIITDGQENVLNEEEMNQIVKDMTNKGITIDFIGLGTEIGGGITPETLGKSVLNEEVLEKITKMNGGSYSIALKNDEILDALNSFIKKKEKRVFLDLSVYFYMISLIILMIEWYFSNYLFRSFP